MCSDDGGQAVRIRELEAEVASLNEALRQKAALTAVIEGTTEHSFRSIVQASPMGMHRYRLEGDGRLVFIGANPAADRMLGVDNDQFVGLTIEEAFPPPAGDRDPRALPARRERG